MEKLFDKNYFWDIDMWEEREREGVRTFFPTCFEAVFLCLYYDNYPLILTPRGSIPVHEKRYFPS